MRLTRIPQYALEAYQDFQFRRIKRRLIQGYDFAGFKRFYHYHCRKTAGTSISKIFMGLTGRDGGHVFKDLGKQTDRPWIENDLIFVGWNKALIEQGDYFFGFSHFPIHQVKVPENTFRFTSLRDPAERLFSHYRMLLGFAKDETPHPCFAEEGKWLGRTFDDFLDAVPMPHLMNQLYMFSESYDVQEAAENILNLDFCFFVESFCQSLAQFNAKTGLQLTHRHDRKSQFVQRLNERQMERLKRILSPEYEMLGLVHERMTARRAG